MALKVKRSQLTGAGKGLYTTSAIKKKSKIIEYKGEIIDWKEYEKRVKEDRDGYLFFINKKRCIDAFDTPEHLARYANDAAGLSRVKGLRNNACYEISGDQCFIVATRDIEAGEEILVSYTKEYWDCIRYNIKNDLYKTKKFQEKK
ncbi:MAG: SET domain-containing protein [Sphingobacteriia bacterium]|jgi:SET domain-containing protein|nr:SET domain-containing protein [Sphingobacteriia bacterium]